MMRFKVWCDSGANIHSRREDVVELDMTEEEFEAMSDDEKDDMFKEYAWERLDWGWEPID